MFVDTSSNLHPFECDGPGVCHHCDRRHTVDYGKDGTSFYSHDPATCALCDPDYDMQPNPLWDERVELEARAKARRDADGE